MGSSFTKVKRKAKATYNSMDQRRNFGLPAGQITPRDPLTPDLFMQIGTRVGNITAFYKHVTPVSPVSPSTVTTQPTINSQPYKSFRSPRKLHQYLILSMIRLKTFLMSIRPVYYLPIHDPDILLEGCKTLLKSLIERIVEHYINGTSNYTNEANIVRVKVRKLEIDYF